MLEIRELSKTYKPKRGVPVTALDRVSIKFADKGMVFLLGKSGSGKSTMLNVLGGLDRYDSGEMLIKGVSSKDFSQSHFDSYRNTYVGFIFQEYNILDEFTVGANIALAIELQSRKATDAEINDILDKVDLTGYGNRRPNELSGGQKQRVAIARALVKNPDIIMADEPTGALDSNTGRQVLETLRRLADEKLVIVVSHDREFAEKYADRIIELADGRIISDVTRSPEPLEKAADGALTFDGDSIEVPAGYSLSEDDRVRINEYLASLSSGARIKMGEKKLRGFRATEQNDVKNDFHEPFKLIKSRLPMKSAFKIGASSLKHKKLRLIFTVLLSAVAFTLFGLSDTFGAYDHINTCTRSLIDSNVSYASFSKQEKCFFNGKDGDFYWNSGMLTVGDDDLKLITDATGIKVKGVYSGDLDKSFKSMYFDQDNAFGSDSRNIALVGFNGFVEFTDADLSSFGYKLSAGSLPKTDSELAVSDLVYECFRRWSLSDADGKEIVIGSPSDLVGKTLTLGKKSYTVSGVVDTGFDIKRYDSFFKNDGKTNADKLLNWALYQEYCTATQYSFAATAFVREGFVSDVAADTAKRFKGKWTLYLSEKDDGTGIYPHNFARLSDTDKSIINWVGEEKATLAKNELIVTASALRELYFDGSDEVGIDELKAAVASRKYTQRLYSNSDNDTVTDCRIVGIIDDAAHPGYAETAALCDDMFELMTNGTRGLYSFAVGAMPGDEADVRRMVTFANDGSSQFRFSLCNPVTFELDTVNGVLREMAKVFLWVGIGFAVFAALMLANFIGTSIAYKKQEIGILRAIGSRGNDVFRIFFSESFIIAMINFVLSFAGTFAVTAFINYKLREAVGVLITVLTFGVRQIALLLVVSVAVAAVASFIPVKRIASKRPIDAIRNR